MSVMLGFRLFFSELESRLTQFSKATLTRLCIRDEHTISAAVKRAPKKAAAVKVLGKG